MSISWAFPKVRNSKVCPKFLIGSKFYFFPHWKTYFSQFIEKFLKFEEMEYFIHHVQFEMWPALCKFPALSSTVKLKLGNNFSQFINRFKIWTLKSWFQAALPSFSTFTKRSQIEVFECYSSWTSQFFPIYGRD